MENFNAIIKSVSDFLWGWPLIILLFGTHIFLTIRLGFPQRKILKAIKLSVTPDKESKGDVSPFHTLATMLAATIGTGNIIGVATAVALGGPGAVFWCWLTGVLGIATKYGEGLLAIKYRVRTSDGTMLGGPMYALERGLKMKWLAVLFCIFTALAAFGIGNTVQANAISTLLSEPNIFGPGTNGVPTYISGLVMAGLVALVIIFGVKGIAKVCGVLVPFMAVFYVGGCIAILCFNHAYVWEALTLIVKSAFNPAAAGGGFVGASIIMVARFGIARGLFSNESGLGSAPIMSAAAQTRNPVSQALICSTATFWDTVVICLLTGLVLVSSIVAHPDISYADGAKLTQVSFSKIPFIGTPILTIGLITFAFSTILGWSYYAEKAVEYLTSKKIVRYYRLVWIVLIFVGSVVDLTLVWNLADITNALMAIPNLLSLILLSGVLASETKYYLWGNRLDEHANEEIPGRE